MKQEKVINKPKASKEDLTAIALFHLAKKYNKEYSKFTEELLKHLSKNRCKKYKDYVENWIWEAVIEDNSYEELVEYLKDFKKDGKR